MNLAVLIDGDNITSSYVTEMMGEIAKYGNPTIKRIYGDWTSPHLSKWKNLLLENAITPIQQYAYTSGKNATDSAMIIDAMDILYSEKVNGFCIVSSDSDFTKLATRLREAGMQVIGIGEKKTPNPFIVSCDKFISSTISDLSDEDDWAFLGDVGGLLQKKQPNFDSRNYGFDKLTPLIKSIGKFLVEERENVKNKNKLIFVKNK
jgi:hypothetical protein